MSRRGVCVRKENEGYGSLFWKSDRETCAYFFFFYLLSLFLITGYDHIDTESKYQGESGEFFERIIGWDDGNYRE